MGNMCMVMFGYEMIHITAYLHGQARNEYCEEISETGKVIMVFNIENASFRNLPIEIPIIRDPLTPLPAEANLAPLTEVSFPTTHCKTGAFSFEREFKQKGHHVVLVTLTEESGARETQHFRFSVGQTWWLHVPYILGAALIGLTVLAYWRHTHPSPKRLRNAAIEGA